MSSPAAPGSCRPFQKCSWVLVLNELDGRRKVLAAPWVYTFGWGVQLIIWKAEKLWLLPTPSWHALLSSKRQDGYFLSTRRGPKNKTKKKHAQQITNCIGASLPSAITRFINARKFLPTVRRHGKESGNESKWIKTISWVLRELCAIGGKAHLQPHMETVTNPP